MKRKTVKRIILAAKWLVLVNAFLFMTGILIPWIMSTDMLPVYAIFFLLTFSVLIFMGFAYSFLPQKKGIKKLKMK